ncbi:histone-lysine N-methyltransferase ATXR4 isoform X2 [Humulus lupulus]|uniref:histone-lysine N-methyltransferase ATXR4 isoform X2 n=1 Tax=Humulus lupulus TaxID=3486 RepID=UPI002B4178DC|nr:histone-lysine N-methyltransferase ATXR4 isoform X2 [Humulus lupulus]
MSNWTFLRHSRSCHSRFKTQRFQNNERLASSFSTSGEGRAANEIPVQAAPPPVRVELTESSGRGVFAIRKIGAGELLHTAKPLVSYPSLSTIQRVCYFCLRKLKNTANDQSQSVAFCSENCENQAKAFLGVEVKADWVAFNDYCRSLGLKYPLLVKRFACMVISGAASANLLDILQPAILSPRMTSEMEEGFGLLKSAFKVANFPDEKMAFLTKQWYTGILARIRINAFRIECAGGLNEDLLQSAAASVETEAAVGNAVYMLPSFYNHDCDPNAHILWIENVDAKLMALRDVEEGEELRICYIDTSMDRGARQTFLSQGFGFHCTCLRCMSGD